MSASPRLSGLKGELIERVSRMTIPAVRQERVLQEFRQVVPATEDCGSASWDDLRALALTGRLRGSGIRSVSWKIFLGVLPSNTTSLADWNACLSEKRSEYDRLVQKFLIDPRGGGDEDLLKNNPLAQAEDSKWTKYFELQELQKCISIDVERLNFDDEYFTRDTEKVQGVMLRVLTVWASINTEVSYRQGMHELLAPILAVLDRDTSAAPAAANGDAAELAGIMDAAFLEHDAYMLFERLMERIGAAFAPPTRGEKGKAPATRAPVVVRCDRVQNTLLRSRDIELCSHLQSNQVPTSSALSRQTVSPPPCFVHRICRPHLPVPLGPHATAFREVNACYSKLSRMVFNA